MLQPVPNNINIQKILETAKAPQMCQCWNTSFPSIVVCLEFLLPLIFFPLIFSHLTKRSYVLPPLTLPPLGGQCDPHKWLRCDLTGENSESKLFLVDINIKELVQPYIHHTHVGQRELQVSLRRHFIDDVVIYPYFLTRLGSTRGTGFQTHSQVCWEENIKKSNHTLLMRWEIMESCDRVLFLTVFIFWYSLLKLRQSSLSRLPS